MKIQFHLCGTSLYGIYLHLELLAGRQLALKVLLQFEESLVETLQLSLCSQQAVRNTVQRILVHLGNWRISNLLYTIEEE